MRRFRAVAASLLIVNVVGCTRTLSIVEDPAPYVESHRPGQIWVTPVGASEMMIESPRILEDTVFGWNKSGGQVVIPVETLENIRVKQLATRRTMALGVVAMAAVALIAATVSGDPNTIPVPDPVADQDVYD